MHMYIPPLPSHPIPHPPPTPPFALHPWQKSEWEAAIYHFQQLLEATPAHFKVMVKLLQLLRRAGRLKEASRFLVQAERPSRTFTRALTLPTLTLTLTLALTLTLTRALTLPLPLPLPLPLTLAGTATPCNLMRTYWRCAVRGVACAA